MGPRPMRRRDATPHVRGEAGVGPREGSVYYRMERAHTKLSETHVFYSRMPCARLESVKQLRSPWTDVCGCACARRARCQRVSLWMTLYTSVEASSLATRADVRA